MTREEVRRGVPPATPLAAWWPSVGVRPDQGREQMLHSDAAERMRGADRRAGLACDQAKLDLPDSRGSLPDR